MINLSMNKLHLSGCTVALLLGFSFPALAGTKGLGSHEGHNGHHDAHAEEKHHVMVMADTVKATVVSIDAAKRQLTLDHEALTNIGMGAMTMGFRFDKGVNISGLKAGDKVKARVEMKQGTGLVITEVSELK